MPSPRRRLNNLYLATALNHLKTKNAALLPWKSAKSITPNPLFVTWKSQITRIRCCATRLNLCALRYPGWSVKNVTDDASGVSYKAPAAGDHKESTKHPSWPRVPSVRYPNRKIPPASPLESIDTANKYCRPNGTWK
ncbi:jg19016 [Pararge aegeria aegeria]|uniref:Jg19016 protein n=1 Tax=Pararge aegeria aegeria TaxID=348720 RepID=A0A8S4QGL8_9NEOP|nr:jg19016 [Pararge aegeria aegeria]